MRYALFFLFAFALPTSLVVCGQPAPSSSERITIGVLGDSNSDEYRADDDRGEQPWKSSTLNWVEILRRYRGVDFGRWDKWPPLPSGQNPRREGYEYNWALSGARAFGMIQYGQVEGLAAQIADPNISIDFVVMFIGSNDWGIGPGIYGQIYSGELAGAELQHKIDSFVEDITAAVDSLLEAGDVKILVIDVGDPGRVPWIGDVENGIFGDPDRRAVVSAVIENVNDRLRSMAGDRGPAVRIVNSADLEKELFPRIQNDGTIVVDPEGYALEVDAVNPGSDPGHLQLADSRGHASTVLNGFIANYYVLAQLNKYWNTDIPLLSEAEIVEIATGTAVSTQPSHDEVPDAAHLRANRPNPFDSVTVIPFDLDATREVSLKIYDLQGRTVATLLSGTLPAGSHEARWDARGIVPGVYLCRLRAGTRLVSRLVVKVR